MSLWKKVRKYGAGIPGYAYSKYRENRGRGGNSREQSYGNLGGTNRYDIPLDAGFNTRELPDGHIAADVQHQVNRAVGTHNAGLRRSAEGTLGNALQTQQVYSRGGASAMANGIYGQLARTYQTNQIDAPDVTHYGKQDAIKAERKAAQKAGYLQAAAGLAQGLLSAGIGGAGGAAAGAAAGAAGQAAAAAPGSSQAPIAAAGQGAAQGAMEAAQGYSAGTQQAGATQPASSGQPDLAQAGLQAPPGQSQGIAPGGGGPAPGGPGPSAGGGAGGAGAGGAAGGAAGGLQIAAGAAQGAMQAIRGESPPDMLGRPMSTGIGHFRPISDRIGMDELDFTAHIMETNKHLYDDEPHHQFMASVDQILANLFG